MTVRAVQLLCASRQRHAVASVAYESANGAPAESISRELIVRFIQLVISQTVEPVCSICGALIVLPPEDSVTDFGTMAEALDHFSAVAAEQEREMQRARQRAANN